MSTPLVNSEMPQDPKISQMLDSLAEAAGMPTRKQAHASNICVICKKEITQEGFASWSEAGRRSTRSAVAASPASTRCSAKTEFPQA